MITSQNQNQYDISIYIYSCAYICIYICISEDIFYMILAHMIIEDDKSHDLLSAR